VSHVDVASISLLHRPEEQKKSHQRLANRPVGHSPIYEEIDTKNLENVLALPETLLAVQAEEHSAG
jgi:hypothetical protein